MDMKLYTMPAGPQRVPLLRGVVLCCHGADLPLPSQFGYTADNFLLFKARACASCALPHPPPGSCRLEILKFMHLILKLEKQYFRREICFHSVTCWPCLYQCHLDQENFFEENHLMAPLTTRGSHCGATSGPTN